MDDYFKYLIIIVIAFGTYMSIDAYTEGIKDQTALEQGYQECAELNSYGHTIVLYKKECK